MKTISIFLGALFAIGGPGTADDKVSQPQTVTHRITGFFAANREEDLRLALEKVPDVKLVSVNFPHGEATFSYDPAIAFKGTKPDKIVERFDGALKQASSHTFGVQPLVPTPKEKLTLIEIPVSGLDCKACCFVAYEAVAKLDGVAQATASFREGRVTALIDPEKTNRAALEEALKKREVKIVTGADAARK